MKIVICGDAPLESEANASIRGSIHDGWEQHLSPENVTSVSLTGAPSVIRALRPDLVLGVGSYLPETAYFGETVAAARAVGAVSAFWATEDPYEKDASYRIEPSFDAIFTCDRWGANFYHHRHVFHLPLAACAQRHFVQIEKTRERPVDIFFCGVAFASRRDLIELLRPVLDRYRTAIIGPGWGAYGSGFSERRISKSELIELYAQSKIVLNLGRSLSFENSRYAIMPSTPGPRTFEAALAGATQVFHEDTAEIHRYFDDDEIPCFSSRHDFGLLCERLLDDEEERFAIAGRAQRKTTRAHTYARRAAEITDVLRIEGIL